MAGRLDGKVAVITGAASGIGAETTRLFQQEGAKVVGVDLSDDAVSDLAIKADVTDPAAVEGVYTQARERFGKIDVLFNNAGISPDDDASILDTSVESWTRCRTSTSSRSSSAASSASPTCSTTVAARSSTPPPLLL